MGNTPIQPDITSTEDQDHTFSPYFTDTGQSQSQFKISRVLPEEIAAKDFNEECANRESLGGWDIGEFSDSTLYLYRDPADEKIYCFPRIDHGLLTDVNPYTNQPLPKKVKDDIFKMEISPPLSFYSRRLCPVFRNTASTVFVAWSQRYDAYYLIDKASGYSALKVFKGDLKTPRRPREALFKRERFADLKLVYDGSYNDIPETDKDKHIKKAKGSGLVLVSHPPLDFDATLLQPSDLFKELQAYMSNSGLALSKGSAETLRTQNIRLDRRVEVFRGFSFKEPQWAVKLDDIIILDDRTDASSWTTNICIAEFFANSQGKGFGYVVQYVASPEEVIIDTRLLDTNTLDKLTETGANQSEILLDKQKRTVKVVMLFENGEYVKRIK